MKEAGLAELEALIAAVRRGVTAPARLYLVSRTSHLTERWRDRVPVLELAGEAGRAELSEAVREAAGSLGLDLVWESPADVIPLPVGWEARSRLAMIGQVAPGTPSSSGTSIPTAWCCG